MENAVMETLIGDGLDDLEVLSALIDSFNLEIRVNDDMRLKSKLITGRVAA
jgi:hypothetical protein